MYVVDRAFVNGIAGSLRVYPGTTRKAGGPRKKNTTARRASIVIVCTIPPLIYS